MVGIISGVSSGKAVNVGKRNGVSVAMAVFCTFVMVGCAGAQAVNMPAKHNMSKAFFMMYSFIFVAL